jgi:hypothetical protein
LAFTPFIGRWEDSFSAGAAENAADRHFFPSSCVGMVIAMESMRFSKYRIGVGTIDAAARRGGIAWEGRARATHTRCPLYEGPSLS